jgi:hypothetical protein
MQLIRIGTLTLAAGTLAVAAACTTPDRAEPSSASAAALPPPVPNVAVAAPVVMSEGSDRTASRTADDWATYADHVLVVTVVGETRQPASKKEIERGKGLIGRTVKLRVDKVLWSAPDAPQPAPASLDMSAAGWIFNNHNGAGERKIALHGASRLEEKHTYIKAVEWIDDPCFDDVKRGSWEGLGSGDAIPFDTGVLGTGEFEGQAQTLTQLRTKWQADATESRTLRGQLAGQPAVALVAGLKAATPHAEGYKPQECDLSDR